MELSLARFTPCYGSILRHSKWDALLVALAAAHAVFLILAPSIALVALGLWWNANTISHWFIHAPFFRSKMLNALFSCCESLLLGIPQTLWKDRHLAHHAGTEWKLTLSRALLLETVLVLSLWSGFLLLAPRFFLVTYLPGYLIGLALCRLQGHYEHRHGTTSHYGWIYNLLFFNDGYHVEHHVHPGGHWKGLPFRSGASGVVSRWPPVLRWLEHVNLETLERLVLRFPLLQHFVLDRHERAFRSLLPELRNIGRVNIVGGGIFPRTALILQRLLPEARITIVDASPENLDIARRFLPENVSLIHGFYEPGRDDDTDLVVIPLSFIGERAAIYEFPPARRVVVHDWIWARRGPGALVSVFLLKRLNLVTR